MANQRKRFRLESIRVLKLADDDAGLRLLRPGEDLQMLVSFLDRFDKLGWIPPVDSEKRVLLAVHDVTIHPIGDSDFFYEFCSKGGRGERRPWLTVFFHVDHRTRIVRICGVEQTGLVERRRTLVVETMRDRVERLIRALRRRRQD